MVAWRRYVIRRVRHPMPRRHFLARSHIRTDGERLVGSDVEGDRVAIYLATRRDGHARLASERHRTATARPDRGRAAGHGARYLYALDHQRRCAVHVA